MFISLGDTILDTSINKEYEVTSAELFGKDEQHKDNYKLTSADGEVKTVSKSDMSRYKLVRKGEPIKNVTFDINIDESITENSIKIEHPNHPQETEGFPIIRDKIDNVVRMLDETIKLNNNDSNSKSKILDFIKHKNKKDGVITVEQSIQHLHDAMMQGLIKDVVYVVVGNDGELVHGCNDMDAFRAIGMLDTGKDLIKMDMWEE